jgi:hypothetical protein
MKNEVKGTATSKSLGNTDLDILPISLWPTHAVEEHLTQQRIVCYLHNSGTNLPSAALSHVIITPSLIHVNQRVIM